MRTRTMRMGRVCLLAAVLAAAGFVPESARADNRGKAQGQPGILPAHARYAGKSYSEWGVIWWQWVLNIPADTNPLLDETGAFASQNQSGPVWLLSGSLIGSPALALTIPSGKAIFMPVNNWIFGATAFDCAPSVPGVACDLATLQQAVTSAVDATQVMEVTIDGRPVSRIRDYRASSLSGFDITLPDESLTEALGGIDIPAGTYGPHVTDGFWLLLTPLSVGEHHIVVHATNPSYDIDYTINYYITVSPGHSAAH